MSWSIYSTGTKKGVLNAVEKATGYGDTSQLEQAKRFLLEEIGKVPEKDEQGNERGVRLLASGHHDEGTRSVSITLESFPLAKAGDPA